MDLGIQQLEPSFDSQVNNVLVWVCMRAWQDARQPNKGNFNIGVFRVRVREGRTGGEGRKRWKGRGKGGEG
jgi:hypothetical protein